MKLPTDTIEHDGEQFQISYNEWFECDESPDAVEHTVPDDPEETYRHEPKEVPSFPGVTSPSNVSYTKRVHYYIKHAINLEDPPLDVEMHAGKLRERAREFEALEANGWEMTQSDGVHVFFEKTEIESLRNEY